MGVGLQQEALAVPLDRESAVLAGERRVFELLTSGVGWRLVLDSICRMFEAQNADVRASIVLIENSATMHPGAAPNIPREFGELLDGVRIGPSAGSCGTAAFTKRRVIVEDIASDPLWVGAASVALRFGLRACFSTPVLAHDGEVLGTFGLYFLTPRLPDPEQLELADRAAKLASIALERRRSDLRLAKLHDELERRIEQRTESLERAVEELRLSRASAEAASAAKTAFLANMSHEIRTPMNAILGLAQVLSQHDNLTPAQCEQLAAIQRSGEHLLSVIDDVLQMSKMEAGRLSTRVHEFALAELLTDVERMFCLQAQNKGLRLRVRVAPSAPARLVSDSAKLRQVLINLVGNAIKFTDQGTVTVEVCAVGTSAARGTLHFVVRDTGVGISEQAQKSLFQPFFQAGDMARRAAGTGLGLAISRRLAELLGGHISVQSGLGVGSVFLFELPFDRVPAGAPVPLVSALRSRAEEPRASTRGEGLELIGRGAAVLIVDDHDLNRRVLVELLRPFGFCVFEAVNGVEALVSFERHKPALVLMDLRMPLMDGYEAMQRIRQAPHGTHVRIIAVTASAFDDDLARIHSSGADEVLRKPFRREQLLSIVEAQLALRLPEA